ncbi:MAG: hypothetical protein ACRCSF_06370 [Mycobacteriaceae bacterium]
MLLSLSVIDKRKKIRVLTSVLAFLFLIFVMISACFSWENPILFYVLTLLMCMLHVWIVVNSVLLKKTNKQSLAKQHIIIGMSGLSFILTVIGFWLSSIPVKHAENKLNSPLLMTFGVHFLLLLSIIILSMVDQKKSNNNNPKLSALGSL